jgi:hypothetical protein
MWMLWMCRGQVNDSDKDHSEVFSPIEQPPAVCFIFILSTYTHSICLYIVYTPSSAQDEFDISTDSILFNLLEQCFHFDLTYKQSLLQ